MAPNHVSLTAWEYGLSIFVLVGHNYTIQVPCGTVAFLIVPDNDSIEDTQIWQIAFEDILFAPGEVVWGVLEDNLAGCLLMWRQAGS